MKIPPLPYEEKVIGGIVLFATSHISWSIFSAGAPICVLTGGRNIHKPDHVGGSNENAIDGQALLHLVHCNDIHIEDAAVFVNSAYCGNAWSVVIQDDEYNGTGRFKVQL